MGKTPNIQNSKKPNKLKESNSQKTYDLEKSLNEFFERVIRFCKKCPLNAKTSRIISQLTGCAGAIPANYAETTEAMSEDSPPVKRAGLSACSRCNKTPNT